jgi:hypothetical protein
MKLPAADHSGLGEILSVLFLISEKEDSRAEAQFSPFSTGDQFTQSSRADVGQRLLPKVLQSTPAGTGRQPSQLMSGRGNESWGWRLRWSCLLPDHSGLGEILSVLFLIFEKEDSRAEAQPFRP